MKASVICIYDFVILLGSPGSGKTTIGELLKEKINSIYIDYDTIREFNFDRLWKNMKRNAERDPVALENLILILKNYGKHKVKNVIVGGVGDKETKVVLAKLKNYNNIIIKLCLSDDEVLKKRVLMESRDSGYRDFNAAIKLNREIRNGMTYPNERIVDSTNQTPDETADQIIEILSK